MINTGSFGGFVFEFLLLRQQLKANLGTVASATPLGARTTRACDVFARTSAKPDTSFFPQNSPVQSVN